MTFKEIKIIQNMIFFFLTGIKKNIKKLHFVKIIKNMIYPLLTAESSPNHRR